LSKIIKSPENRPNIRPARFNLAEFEAKGKALLERARQKAAEISEQARKALQNARTLEEKARNEKSEAEAHVAAAAEEARKEAFEQGKGEGLEAGHAEGLQKGIEEAHREAYKKAFKEKQAIVEEEAAPLIERVNAILEPLESGFERIRSRARAEVLQLAVAVASKIVRREVNLDPNIVLASVHKAIDLSLQKHTVRVIMNTEDLAAVSQYLPAIRTAFARVENINLVSDDTMPQGGCIVESGSGTVDMRIETQLAKIERELLQRTGGA
jgi:flagellar assembly protein FliH